MDINIIAFFEANKYLLLLIISFLGRLGFPVGTTFFILFAGALTTSYEELFLLFCIGIRATILGDLFAYFIGKRFFYTKIVQKQIKKEKVKTIFDKTELFFKRRGNISIFISRFLVTQIGPYLNYILGIQSFNFKLFTKLVILGEIIYVVELLVLGYIFRDSFDYITDIFYYLGILLLVSFILYKIVKIIIRKRI